MPEDLLSLVQKHFLPKVASLGLQVVEHEEGKSFGNALTVLAADDLRIRIVRERGQIFVDLGSAAAPSTWFDSAVVMELLGLSASAGWHADEASTVLDGLASFLRAFWEELRARFSRADFSRTQQELV